MPYPLTRRGGETISEVRAVREELGLTQGQFAALLGVHPVTISKWESGVLQPTAYQLGLIRHFGKAAKKRPRSADDDLGTLIITIGVIGVLGLLFSWAADEYTKGGKRR